MQGLIWRGEGRGGASPLPQRIFPKLCESKVSTQLHVCWCTAPCTKEQVLGTHFISPSPYNYHSTHLELCRHCLDHLHTRSPRKRGPCGRWVSSWGSPAPGPDAPAAPTAAECEGEHPGGSSWQPHSPRQLHDLGKQGMMNEYEGEYLGGEEGKSSWWPHSPPPAPQSRIIRNDRMNVRGNIWGVR